MTIRTCFTQDWNNRNKCLTNQRKKLEAGPKTAADTIMVIELPKLEALQRYYKCLYIFSNGLLNGPVITNGL